MIVLAIIAYLAIGCAMIKRTHWHTSFDDPFAWITALFVIAFWPLAVIWLVAIGQFKGH